MKLRKFITSVLTPSILSAGCVMLSSSCSSRNESKENTVDHFVVDASSFNDDAAERLNSLVTLTAVKLQMPDSLAIKASGTFIVNSDCKDRFVLEYDYGFFIFNREGELLTYFNRKGQGPEEYNYAKSVAMEGDTIYVLDTGKIQKYDISGNYIGTISGLETSRGQLAINKSGLIYLQHALNAENHLTVYSTDGSLIANMFPTKEVVRNFMIPSSQEMSLSTFESGVVYAPAFEQTIYILDDTTARQIATFDFGKHNISNNFFAGTTEEVENEFHQRRDQEQGFAYFDGLFVNEDWVSCEPIGIPADEARIVMADRRTGNTYSSSIFPQPLKMILGSRPYFAGYDTPSKSFVKVVSGDILEETLENHPESIKKANFETFNSEDDDFIILINFK